MSLVCMLMRSRSVKLGPCSELLVLPQVGVTLNFEVDDQVSQGAAKSSVLYPFTRVLCNMKRQELGGFFLLFKAAQSRLIRLIQFVAHCMTA